MRNVVQYIQPQNPMGLFLVSATFLLIYILTHCIADCYDNDDNNATHLGQLCVNSNRSLKHD